MFYLPNLLPSAETFVLSEEESSHCIRVLRKQPGDEIQVLDGKGGLYTAAILDAHPKKVAENIELLYQYDLKSKGVGSTSEGSDTLLRELVIQLIA